MGMGIDNAIVELDNLEIPILDGSAQPFVDMIVRAGIRGQRRRRASIRILRPLELREGSKCIAVYPDNNYSVAYTIDFPHPLIGRETFRIDLSNGEFLRELASARTFGFLEQEAALRNMGLIRGASRDNCIVLTAEGVENGPLRFPNEFVRHKVLDLIGDLALLGQRLIGRVVADRAGHAMHTALVSRLLKDHSFWEEAADEVAAEPAVKVDVP